jgi:hypothetical protein
MTAFFASWVNAEVLAHRALTPIEEIGVGVSKKALENKVRPHLTEAYRPSR